MRDRHAGETCVIAGNGPSMTGFDVQRLADVPTFGLNRGYLLWQAQGLSPTYHVVINDLVLEQFRDELVDLSCPLFLPWIYRRGFEEADQAVFLELRPFSTFITDARRGVAPGATVTIAALQLAFHMGYSTVVLLGIDHRFQTQGPPHSRVVQQGDDLDHFDPNYFPEGTTWNLPDLAASERGYRASREQYEAAGRRIVNASRRSALTVFQRGRLEDILEEERNAPRRTPP
jgi:hypothetical protein